MNAACPSSAIAALETIARDEIASTVTSFAWDSDRGTLTAIHAAQANSETRTPAEKPAGMPLRLVANR